MNDLVKQILAGGDVRKLIDEASTRRKFKAKYIISSERAASRSDEDHVEFYSDRIMDVGDEFELDGLTWYVDEVVSDADRGIGEAKGDPLSSKYACSILTYDPEKMRNPDFVPWSFLSFTDDGRRTNDGAPWVRGAFGNEVIAAKNGHNGATALYLVPISVVNRLLKVVNRQDARYQTNDEILQFIDDNCDRLSLDAVDYESIFDRAVNEAKVKGTGKRINFEDDLVRVYDSNGKEVYAGLEDYEPMKDEDWVFDKANGYYTCDGYIKVCV